MDRVVGFLTEHAVVDHIIRHLKLTFVAEKPPPSRFFEPVVLAAAERSGNYYAALRRGVVFHRDQEGE